MSPLKTSASIRAERNRAKRLEIARGLYQALVAQDPDRVITLYFGSRVLARHDLRSEQDAGTFGDWLRAEARFLP
jgi:hypothetical protein